jgi:4-amino-4-deoxy-L-arabinose transferase-like glycosyltransferase
MSSAFWESRGERAWDVASFVVALLVLVAIASNVRARDGNFSYDDAHYVYRGLFHANQVLAKGNLLLPRLAWSLSLEDTKPPLFVGLVAIGGLLFGTKNPEPIYLWATLVPAAILCFGMILCARHASGSRGGLFTLMFLWGMPSFLGIAKHTMVETLLSSLVAMVLYLCLRRRDRFKLLVELLLGLCAGLAMLTKLTAAIFVGPMMLLVVLWVLRYEGARRATLLSGRIALVASVVCAPWYVRHLVETLLFSAYAASFALAVDVGSPVTRPFRLIMASVGLLPALIGVAILVFSYRKTLAGQERRDKDLARLAACVAVPAAIIVCLPKVFEPRYFLPALVPVAVWVGSRAANLLSSHEPAWRRCVGPVGTVALAAWSIGGLWSGPASSMPWQLTGWLEDLTPSGGRIVTIGVLGNSPSWNVFRLQLLSELGAEPRRRRFIDLLPLERGVDGPELAWCDYVLLLDDRGISGDSFQQRLNAEQENLASLVAGRNSGFVRCPALEDRRTSEFPIRVFRRRDEALAGKESTGKLDHICDSRPD